MNQVTFIFGIFLLLRLISLCISVRNEKRIKQEGGIQYGRINSLLLTVAHILFYFSCLYEAYHNDTLQVNSTMAKIGFGLLVFAYTILFYVIYELKNIWTLKIYILKNHTINKSFLFRYVRHPNYFLNIIPELIGISFLCSAYTTLIILMPFYLVILSIRIYQEEKAMKHIVSLKDSKK